MLKSILNEKGRYLTLDDGGAQTRFYAIWLRDNAWDAATWSADNGQLLITLHDMPCDTFISAASLFVSTLSVTVPPEDKTVEYDTK